MYALFETALYVDALMGEDLRPQIVTALVGKGIDVLELRRREISLEEIFSKLTTEEVEDNLA